jgi:hypothetical protein
MNKRIERVTLVTGLAAASLLLALVCGHAADELSASQARKLIANVAGSRLPTSAVRVRSVSVTGSSAIVEAQVETAFRFERSNDGKWRVAEIRTGDDRWEDVGAIERAVNAEKAERARAELETLATAHATSAPSKTTSTRATWRASCAWTPGTNPTSTKARAIPTRSAPPAPTAKRTRRTTSSGRIQESGVRSQNERLKMLFF